ncbi:MAG: C40 family peptidase [Planctomycetota bacterium]
MIDNLQMERRKFLKNMAGAAAVGGIGLCLPSVVSAALSRDQATKITKAARSKLDLKYVYGATDITKSTDCSLLTQWCYSQAGLVLPRTAASQFSTCKLVSQGSGSLLFFATDDSRPGVVSHVGISLGDGTMIDANTVAGKVVLETWETNSYWKKRFLGGRSLV